MLVARSSTLVRSAATLLLLSASAARAIPAGLVEERDTPGFFDDVLLFDSPAVLSDPTRVQVTAYTYMRQFDIDLSPLLGLFSSIGIDLSDLGDKASTVADRLKLFVSIPRSGKEVELNIAGCGDVKLNPSDDEIDGITVTDVTCQTTLVSDTALNATVDLSDRGMTAKVFPSSIDGFGVISDVDDTIKVSHVLDKLDLVKKTFIEDPEAVAGMPQLYSSLKTQLEDPLFTYVSGSPFHLYPFLDGFISDNYPDGPKYLRNLTVFDLPQLIQTLTDENSTFTHKINSITRLVDLYPKKQFLMIGDSTEKDPEIYAKAFDLFPQSVLCIWIRKVDEAENSDERFAAAFEGVPSNKVRTFTDDQIAALGKLDVANGKC